MPLGRDPPASVAMRRYARSVQRGIGFGLPDELHLGGCEGIANAEWKFRFRDESETRLCCVVLGL